MPMGESGPRMILEIRTVGKIFGGFSALQDVSINVEKGRIHAIIGPNGAGKTTLYGCVKSPSAALRFTFIVAAYLNVRFTPQFLRALHLELFTQPSGKRIFTRSSKGGKG